MKKNKLLRGRISAGLQLLALSAMTVSFAAKSSPWLEPDNTYLRSDLQVLADAGLITTPINTYPVRWSHVYEQLNMIDANELSPVLAQAYAHVNYAIQGALIDRGNRRFKVAYAKNSRDDSSFAAPMTQHWQALSSYELTSTHYAFRLAANYERRPDKSGNEQDKITLDNSYISFNADNANIEFGSRQRWWGPTWIYNLAWGHTRGTIPGIDLAYDGYNWPVIGSWHVETFIGHLETTQDDAKQWSSRFEFSPVSWFDLGFGYQRWYAKDGFTGYFTGLNSSDSSIDQYHGDVRISLPKLNFGSDTLTQSIYAQASTLNDDNSIGSVVYGWQSQFNIGQQYLRWVLEAKTLSSDAKEQWQQGMQNKTTMAGLNNDLALNNADVGESKTVKLLWVTPNDWEWTMQLQRYQNTNEEDKDKLTASIQLPLANSLVTLGGDYNKNPDAGVDQWNYWGSWDFRF